MISIFISFTMTADLPMEDIFIIHYTTIQGPTSLSFNPVIRLYKLLHLSLKPFNLFTGKYLYSSLVVVVSYLCCKIFHNPNIFL